MTNRPKQRGTALETLVVDYLNAHGFPEAHRLVLHGAKDLGDVGGLHRWALECKNSPRYRNLEGWLREAEVEAGNAGADHFALVHKRMKRGQAGDQFVTLPLGQFVELLVAWVGTREKAPPERGQIAGEVG